MHDVQGSLDIIRAVFDNEVGPALDVIGLNAGAAIYVGGLSPDLAQGIARARQVIAEGKAKQKFEQFIEFTRSLAE